MKINGESGDVSGETVDSWLLQGYRSEDIWNLDVLCLIMAWQGKDHSVKVERRPKRITVANAAGEKESAIIIWKSE